MKKGGKITEREAQTLEESGFGGQIAEDYRASTLKDQDKDTMSVLGEDKGVNEATDKLGESGARLAQAMLDEMQVSAKLAAAKQREIEATEKLEAVITRIAGFQAERQGVTLDAAPGSSGETAKSQPTQGVPGAGGAGSSATDLQKTAEGGVSDINAGFDDAIKAMNMLTGGMQQGFNRFQLEMARQAALQQMHGTH